MRIIDDSHLLTSTEKTLIDDVLIFKFSSRSFYFDSLAGSLEIEIDPKPKSEDGAPIDRQEVVDALSQAEKEQIEADKELLEAFKRIFGYNNPPRDLIQAKKDAENKLWEAKEKVNQLKGYLNQSDGTTIVPSIDLFGEFEVEPTPRVIIYLGSLIKCSKRDGGLIATLVHELFHAFNYFKGGKARSVREVDEPMVEFAAGIFLKAMSQTDSSFNAIYTWHQKEVYSKTKGVGEIACYGFGRYLMDNVATKSKFGEDQWIESYAKISSSINPTRPIVSAIQKELYPFYPAQSEPEVFQLFEELIFPSSAKKKSGTAGPVKTGKLRRFYTVIIKGSRLGPYKMWEVIREFIFFRLNNGVPFSTIYNEISKGKKLISDTPGFVSCATGKTEGKTVVFKGGSYYITTQLRDNKANDNFRIIRDYINNNYPDFQITEITGLI